MHSKPLRRLIGMGRLILLCALTCRCAVALPEQKSVTVEGEVLTDQDQPIPEALCTLVGGLLPSTGITVASDYRGKFRFLELPPGRYTLTCAAMGFKPVKKSLEIEREAILLQVILTSDKVWRQSIEIQEKAAAIATDQPSRATRLSARQLTDLPMVEQKFKAALAIIPGVIRTPDGRINVKGLPENQGLLVVDNAETVDPVTGSFSIDIPKQSIESLEVHANAYRAEYGGASGGLTSITTKPPSSQWHFEVEDLTPNPRIKSGTLVGIADYNPRLYITGPLQRGRLNFSEALGYDIDKQPVRGLAWPHNEIKTHDFNSYTTLQYAFSSRHLATFNFNVFPLRKQFANISSLVAQPASADYGQKGFAFGFNDRILAFSGTIFTTVVQATKFDSNSHGQGALEMLVTPEGWGGDFFNTVRRFGSRGEISENISLPQRTWHGKHQVAVGGGYFRRAYEGSSFSHPVRLLRSDGSLAQSIEFSGLGQMSASDSEAVLFGQDHWAVSESLAFDLGVRYLGESLGSAANLAPRAGVAYSPYGTGKTILRAGIGVFNDHAPLLAGDFTHNPVRTVTLFDAAGALEGGPLTYRNLYEHRRDVGGPIYSSSHPHTTPYNVTWSLEADHQLRPNAIIRASFLSSRSHNQFVVRPMPDLDLGPALVLSPAGSSDYHEFVSTLHVRPIAQSEWSISYVFSRSRGDLNSLSQIYVPFEQPVIRPNVFSYLPSDVPHRLISWGRFKTHLWGIVASPLIDWHSGFHYSVVDERQNYVGQPNRLRFPRFFSLDLKLSKDFRLPFPWIKKHVLRGALTVVNLTNHDNPRDVYNNVTSPIFGHYAGFQHTFLDTNLTILY